VTHQETGIHESAAWSSVMLRLAQHPVLLQLLVVLLYVAAATLGLHFARLSQQLTLVWPPSGIGIAAILLFGTRIWPALAIGSILATVMDGESLQFAVMASTGNLLEALLGAYVLRNAIRFHCDLGRVRDVLGFVLFGVAIAAMVGATFGTAALGVNGIVPWSDAGRAWRSWWAADAMGILVVGALLLSWSVRSEQPWTIWRTYEAAGLVLSLILVVLPINGGVLPAEFSQSLLFLSFPFVIWAALRFGQRGTTGVIALTIAMAIWGTLRGGGPFAEQSVNVAVVFFYGYTSAVAVTGLLLGAATTERRRSADELQRIGFNLEIRVNERTAALQEELARRQRIQEDLQEALASVKTLSGLLPICSSCKRIRDDHGYWTQVERYLTEQTGAQFSHGLCPECFRTLYPEYVQKNGGAGQ
jgi:integral membrane sensor domain MASE1